MSSGLCVRHNSFIIGKMSDRIQNAKEFPTVWYGRHMAPGVAEYRELGTEPFRIFLNEQTIRDMDPTFAGKPVYVRHVDEVDLNKLQVEADGYVIESFYNACDGHHWVKFIVVSDKGREAIRKGWRLSNAYKPKSYAPGGMSKGVEYQKEVCAAEYEHLAIVPDPRYEDSIVLTPTQFKEHNENHLLELKKVANSKTKEKPIMFDFFKKSKVDNSAELSEMTVRLESGKEVTIAQLVNTASKHENTFFTDQPKTESAKEKTTQNADPKDPHDEDMDMKPEETHKETPTEEKKHGRADEDPKDHEAPQMANMDHHVQVGNGTMALKDFMTHHKNMYDGMHKMYNLSASDLDAGEKSGEEAHKADLTKTNADAKADGGEKEACAQKEESDKTKKNSFFEELKNAPERAFQNHAPVDLDRIERGKSRYGSGSNFC